MLDNISWNVFRQTGNIETYLLMKEMETQDQNPVQHQGLSSDLEPSEDLEM